VLDLAVVWLHVMAATAWVGGLLYAGHVVAPAAARGSRDALQILAGARAVGWTAAGLLVLTGIENLRRVGLGSPWLAGKLLVVLLLIPLAAHRDFALLPRAARAVAAGAEPGIALRGVRLLDRAVTVLALVVLFLAVGVARGR
jgi:putative copper export protein